MRIRILVLVALVVLTATAVGGAAMTKWETVPVQPGQGLFVPCSSGIVTAYVMDGMAVVECHAQPAQEEARRK